ncbi:hypothetical protein KI387_003266, partial [Taxus chinensis]
PIQVHNNVEERAYDNDDSGTHNEEEDTYMGDTTSQLNEDGVNEFLQDFYTYAEEVDDSPLTQLARTPLYPNANLSVLATLMLFLNLKVMHGMTNTCFTDILRIVEVIKQIHALESTLLESTGLAAPEQEENGMPPDVPNGEATVTPTTATISTVNTKGKKEVTILLTSDGNVLKDEMGSKFFQFLFHRAECLFGNTIQVDWRKQANSKKDELFEDVIKEFGNPGFNKDFIMDYARKFIHSKRDKIRSKLTNDLRYPRPAWITNQTTWDELIKDAKFKRKSFKNPNYMPSAREGGKRRLRDTTKATQARLSSIGSHKLGSGGYNSIRGSLVHHFRKEASDEDLKYALMHGSQGLRQHMIDRGEKLVIEHESEDVQQSNSLKGATDSEHEDATEGCDDFVAGQNESIDLLGTHLENNPEIQQTRVQDDYHVAPSIIVPRQKRTKKNRHFSYPAK